jgi:hypothetical protein
MVWIPLSNGSGQVVKGIKLKNPETGSTKTVASTSRKGINRYEITFTDGSKTMNHQIRKKKGFDGWSVVGGFHSPEKIAQLYGRKVDPDANLPRPMRASFWKMKSKPGTHNYRQKKKLMKDPKFKKFKEYFATTLDESEQLDELSPATKSSYVKKASSQLKKVDRELGAHERESGGDEGYSSSDRARAEKLKDTRFKRYTGLERAKRMSEELLDEGPKDAAGKDVFVKKIAKSAGVDYKKAGAIAAAAGRKRLGNKEFQKRVEAGQKAARAAKARGEKYKG